MALPREASKSIDINDLAPQFGEMPLIDRQSLFDTGPKPPPSENESPAAPASANGAEAYSNNSCGKVAAGRGSCKIRETDASQPRRQTATILKVRPDLAKARRRFSELHRLVAFRHAFGVEMGEPEAYARLIAEACAQEVREPDILHFQKKARSLGLTFDPDLAVEKLHAVCRERTERGAAWRAIGPDRAGRALGVTAEEREACDIRTLGATDETKAERTVRLAVDRRERAKHRMRVVRAEGKRLRAERIAGEVKAAASQKPFAHYKKENLSECERDLRLEPWKQQGLSRATYFRRLKVAREAARQAEAEVAALADTDLSSLESESKNLTVSGRSHLEFVTGPAGYVSDAFEADRELRKAARRLLGRQPEPCSGESPIEFIRRRADIDREIIASVGLNRWRAMAALVLEDRLPTRTLTRVLADAGLSSEQRGLAA
ncbi:hypothetical protein [Methylopila sp. M107]|uniref:hypothetical protein n=1 Tax=Methylopila sp. M107 TaxID=1101190 RepID=UPI0012DED94B|nr:hypothetical protein [Methylopila sp. M107]